MNVESHDPEVRELCSYQFLAIDTLNPSLNGPRNTCLPFQSYFLWQKRRPSLTHVLVILQVNVEILQIISDEDDTTEAKAGENVKLKVRGVEEEVRVVAPCFTCFLFPSSLVPSWSPEIPRYCSKFLQSKLLVI